MSDKRGIFSLEEFYDLQVSGEATDIFDVFKYVTLVSNNGYFAGGYPSYNPESRISRYDYSNDTVQDVSTFGVASLGYYNGGTFLRHNQCVGNSNFGYFAGEWGFGSAIIRYDYGNDTTGGVRRAQTSVSRDSGTGVGNSNFGYIAGGSNPGRYSTVDRIDYGNDNVTTLIRGNMTRGAYALSGCGNKNYGYLAGGKYGSPKSSSVDRITYASDTATASPKGKLYNNVAEHAAAGNANYGYLSGNSYTNTTIQRIDYANDTAQALKTSNLSVPKYSHGATSSDSFGYHAGGKEYNGHTGHTTIDRIDYANDTAQASPKGSLVRSNFWLGGVSAKANGLPTAPIPLSRVEGSKIVDKGSDGFRTIVNQSTGPAYGYFAGGYGTPSMNQTYSTTDRIDYANDTNTATFRANMPNAGNSGQQNKASVSSVSYAWFAGGGNYSNNISQVTKLDYANDTSFNPSGSLSSPRFYAAGVGNKDYGYIGGGFHPSSPSYPNPQGTWIDRIDYANDSSTTVRKGSLTAAVNYTAAAGNLSFGYWGGGDSSPGGHKSEVSRLDYANDTNATAPKGPLTQERKQLGATGNADFGYFMGGRTGPSGYSIIDRVDYSNDTATALARHPLVSISAIGVYDNRGITGNSTHGYMATGAAWGYGVQSAVYRTDYANDTASPSPKGPLTLARGSIASASAREGDQSGTIFSPYASRIRFIDNLPISSGTTVNNFGYFGGGRSPSYPSGTSMIDRMDFASDTGGATPRSSFLYGTGYSIGSGADRREFKITTGNTNFGYFLGDPNSICERLDYSNDTNRPVMRGFWARFLYPAYPSPYYQAYDHGSGAGFGNSSFGYFGGGGRSQISRIDYSNDNADMTVNGYLSAYRYHGTASGNSSFGYYAGGSGSPGNPTSTVDRIDYANDTATASTKGPLASATKYAGGTGNADFGYVLGGFPAPNGVRVQRIDYANDTATAIERSTLLSPLPSGQKQSGATSSDSAAYLAGGSPAQSSTSPVTSSIQKIDYANDMNQPSPSGTLSISKSRVGAVSPLINGLPRIVIPSSIVEEPFGRPFPFPQPLPPPSGYFAGGYNYNPVYAGNDSQKVERIDFTNDTATALVRGDLSHSPGNMLSVTSSLTHGYVAGGHVVPVKSTISRIDYANDTALSSTKGPLSFARGKASGFGNKNYGYHAGGMNFIGSPSFSAIAYSIVDRVDYANDTATASPKGPLSSASAYQTGGGNLSYGYYVGQSPSTGGLAPAKTNVQRTDYANDTGATSQRGNMNIGRSVRAAAGNKNYGYFTTGYAPSPSNSDTSRIDYANDNVTASPKGNFWVAAYKSGGTGTSDYGYIAVGFTPTGSTSGLSTVGRIDYANDTVTVPQRGTMAIPKASRPQGFSAEARGLPS